MRRLELYLKAGEPRLGEYDDFDARLDIYSYLFYSLRHLVVVWL